MENNKSPERKIMNGRISKTKRSGLIGLRKDRKPGEREERLRKVTKQRHTTVSRELLELYESLYGVAEQVNRPITRERSESSSSYTPQKQVGNNVNGVKYTNYYPVPILKEKIISTLRPVGFIDETLPQFAKTTTQQTCYTYYNPETFEQINSFEPLDEYEKSNVWLKNRSIVNVPKLVRKKRVSEQQERSYWTYYNMRTGELRSSFQKLEKTSEEIESYERITVPQFIENPEEFSHEAEYKKIEEIISQESKKIIEENREFATEEEIQDELQCLESVEEMEAQAAIKHIKEENKNDDNLKAYILS